MGPDFTHLPEIGSTNDWLLARVQALPDGHWVIADRQTAGRGRRGRVWNDGAGNFMGSVLVHADGPVQQLSFVAALAVVEALGEIISPPSSPSPLAGEVGLGEAGRVRGPQLADGATPHPAALTRESPSPARGEGFRLKWPNDVLLNGTKCVGILLERQGSALVVGIGINLAHHPEGTERPATSLAAAGLPVPQPLDVLERLAARFTHWQQIWAREGFAPVRAAWLAHAGGLGQRMVARLGTEAPEGRFDGLAADGALLLRLDDGSVQAIHAGEVFAI
ncbi:biotin--[acetyl-CoA-carboxylase] ligase [Sandarakinorhabdus sp.]|uniref:biotin--[acetyl-CoA-carboxylase] ligase n=1 Tax=Sandarakinorhabdus sp. TaxID=1916663 RepID=UPI00334242ED